MKKKGNRKGITLIALVITIIIMIILVAVSVALAIKGDLFGNAQEGTDKTRIEAEKEQLTEYVYGQYKENIDGKVEVNLEEVKDILNADKEKFNGDAKIDGDKLTVTGKSGEQYIVYKNGIIENNNEKEKTDIVLKRPTIESFSTLTNYINEDLGMTWNDFTKNIDLKVLIKDEKDNVIWEISIDGSYWIYCENNPNLDGWIMYVPEDYEEENIPAKSWIKVASGSGTLLEGTDAILEGVKENYNYSYSCDEGITEEQAKHCAELILKEIL